VRMLAGGTLLGTIAERFLCQQAHHGPARGWGDTRHCPLAVGKGLKRRAPEEEQQRATDDGPWDQEVFKVGTGMAVSSVVTRYNSA
jgi:hypothetical protein